MRHTEQLSSDESPREAAVCDKARNPSGVDQTLLAAGAITVSRGDSGITADVPLTAVDSLFWREDAGQVHLSSDARLLRSGPTEADPQALYSLLQFGAIIPPLSPWKGIHRLVPGYRYSLDERRRRFVREHSISRVQSNGDFSSSDHSEDRSSSQIAGILDEILADRCTDHAPVITFSGGVDSGLLAARAASLRGDKAVLAHYSFGEQDRETVHALAMAKALRLNCITVEHSVEQGLECLKRPAHEFSQPFGDLSVMPTSALARAVIERCDSNSPIVDGTGADGCFGMFGKRARWAKLMSLPRFGRRALSGTYHCLALWKRTGRVEWLARLARRSVQLPQLAAVVGQNPLHGIFYDFDGHVRDQVHDSLATWIADLGLPAESRIPAIDLALICCNVFVPKAKDLWENAGFDTLYPYLDRRCVDLALTQSSLWPDAKHPKATLKHMLAQHVPREMVYRPKSGFVGPLGEAFADPVFLRHFDEAVSERSVISDFLDRSRLRKLRKELAAKRRLPMQTYSFVWAMVFAAAWYRDSLRLGSSDSLPKATQLVVSCK